MHSTRLSALFLFLRALLWTVLFPGVVAGFIPWRFFGLREASISSIADFTALALVGIGAALLLSSIIEFARRGKGTLSLADPPTRLVVSGPYRWVRNPMYAGVLFILVGESIIVAQPGIVLYAAAFFIITNVFIARFEEPYLERTFGPGYVAYKANVRRWIPRASPWRAG